ncbi:MAG: pilus assembly protein PilP [Burkholderiaceae bacterium]|jgi:type IV pilus assembly protein PilP|nr:MAG: pilus assembly protein PilP [Burkholderiaceae bacterium]
MGAALAALVLLATGCSQGHADLDAWIAQERQQAVPKVTPLKQPTVYTPLAYSQASAPDPFSQERLTRVLRTETTRNTGASLIARELERRKEPLEAFPLDVMSMVGTLDGGGKKVALVRVDRLLYQVRVGEHLGQHYGLVTAISDNEVTLREVVQDATGDWIERAATLQLQQQEKKNG